MVQSELSTGRVATMTDRWTLSRTVRAEVAESVQDVGVELQGTTVTGCGHSLFLSSRDMDARLSLLTSEQSVGDSWKETDTKQHEAPGGRDDQRTPGTI
jgi:hypothetical protein